MSPSLVLNPCLSVVTVMSQCGRQSLYSPFLKMTAPPLGLLGQVTASGDALTACLLAASCCVTHTRPWAPWRSCCLGQTSASWVTLNSVSVSHPGQQTVPREPEPPPAKHQDMESSGPSFQQGCTFSLLRVQSSGSLEGQTGPAQGDLLIVTKWSFSFSKIGVFSVCGF